MTDDEHTPSGAGPRPGGRAKDAADPARLGDFTTTPQVLVLAGAGVAIGALSAAVAWALLRLIGVFTNLFFYQRWSAAMVRRPATASGGSPSSPGRRRADHRRHGALRLGAHPRPRHPRGHRGDPHQRQPRRAPRGPPQAAVLGDLDRLGRPVRRRGADHHDRRRVRLAGRASSSSSPAPSARRCSSREPPRGMSATFASPVAAMLLAVELLLFEWKPRSFVPVALASATAAVVRPLPASGRPAVPDARRIRSCSAATRLARLRPGRRRAPGVLALLLTQAVYAARGRVPTPADPLDVVAGASAAWSSASAA